MTPEGAVVAWGTDLLDRSKVAAASPGAVFVGSIEELGERCSSGTVAVVDLSRPGWDAAVRAAAARGARVVGFGSHVDRERLQAARAAGCDARTRAAFFADVAAALAGAD